MKQAFVSFLALVLMAATFAIPAHANGSAQGEHVAVYLEDFPETVAAGETMTGTVTVVVTSTRGVKERFRGDYEIFVASALGDASIQSGSFRIAPNSKRSAQISLPIEADAKAATMAFKIVVTVAGETVSVDHTFTVV